MRKRRLTWGMLATLAAGAIAAQSATIPGGSGPYPAILESDPGLPTHTVYRPADLTRIGRRLPIVAWGNGGCANRGDAQRNFLREIASHGMLVIAVGPPGQPTSGTTTPPSQSAPTRAEQLTEAIDWALAESGHRDSLYYDRLDSAAIAVMGYSCGGLQALAASIDPRIRTTVLWNSGVLPPDDRRPGMNVTKETLAHLHAPIAYFNGGPTDIAYPNGEDDFQRITGILAFKANLDVGHGGTYAEPDGGAFGAVGASWLKWRLLDDARAATMFEGPNCGLCSDPRWAVEKKNLR